MPQLCNGSTSHQLVFLHTTYTCAFKPGCLMSHNWLHTPDCKLCNEHGIPEEVPFWLCCTASQQCRSTGCPTACLIAAALAPHSSGIALQPAWAQSVPRTSLPVPETPGKISTQCIQNCPAQKGMHGFMSSEGSAAHIHQGCQLPGVILRHA